jgi:glycosyltransferase involved in cell wall biosynthesis
VTRPDEMRRLAEAGLEQAKRFSWQRTATETLETFRAALRA